jgi:maleylpyruvate isomerase
MHNDPTAAISVCVRSHQRLLETVAGIDDTIARRPSLLPDWTVGHVLTHLARNADGIARRLVGSLRGEEVARYPDEHPRDADIEAGAGRSAAELLADVTESAARLEEVWQHCEDAGWPNAELLAGDGWPTVQAPVRRLREVEVHHVDLGLAYTCADWPEDYLAWELPRTIAALPKRVPDPADRRRLLAWVIGRGEFPSDMRVNPW